MSDELAGTKMNGRVNTVAKKKRDLFRWYLLIPTLVFLAYFAIVPTIFLFRIAFLRYEIVIPDYPSRFVGLKNFVRVLSSSDFWHAGKVTVWLSVISPIIELLVGLGLALLLAQVVKGRRIITTILLIPMMVAPAAAGFNFRTLYNVQFGPLNYFLGLIGLPKANWAGSPRYAIYAIMLIQFWQWSPFMMVLLYAGLSSLPTSIYESAALQSRSAFQTFVHITLPLLKPFILLGLVLRFMDSFKNLAVIWIVTGGGPGIATENLAYLTFRTSLRAFDMGSAAVMSIVQLVIIVLVCSLLLKPMSVKVSTVKLALA